MPEIIAPQNCIDFMGNEFLLSRWSNGYFVLHKYQDYITYHMIRFISIQIILKIPNVYITNFRLKLRLLVKWSLMLL